MSEDVVDAGPSRQHLKMLEYRGMTQVQMSRLSDVPRSTIVGLMVTGPRQWGSISRATADRLLAIAMPDGYLTADQGGAHTTPDVEPAQVEASVELADEDSDIEPHTALAAAKVAACYADNADELRMLLDMLGIGKAVLA